MAEAITLKEYYEKGLNNRKKRKNDKKIHEDTEGSLGGAYYNAFEMGHNRKNKENSIRKYIKGEIVKFIK